MGKVLIIGAGGVGQVVTHKCAQVPDVFTEICLASRTLEKCDRIAAQLTRPIKTARVDADNVPELVDLIKSYKPDLVLNVALPYQDLHIMDACLETGVDYLDTANYEPPDEARFCYGWQWEYRERFEQRNIMALLGSGFDPGVTNVFCAWAMKHHFDEIHELDIIDCNAGDHGHPFATNFNPEINIREVTAKGRYWEKGEWIETEPLLVSMDYDFPEGIGPRKIFLMYHEELESLALHLKGLKRARFWMTFSENYLNHLKVLENVGMTRIDPVVYEGREIVPLKFLKALLPDPASLGPVTKGRTCIGCLIKGVKDGREKEYYVYNICDHEEAFREVRSQAISYTTGVPAMIGAMMMMTGAWKGSGVFNMEQFDPDPFMEKLNEHGLPWTEIIFEKLNPERIPTPCFVVDEARLKANLDILDNVQKACGAKILLALKGFAMFSTFPLIAGVLHGVCASSPHEARLGRKEFGREVHTFAAAYKEEDLPDLIGWSDCIVFNSFAQWRRFRPLIARSGREIECGLRVNPEHSEVSVPMYDPCASGSRLGVTRQDFEPDELEGISGLHFHTLCESNSDALERTLAVFEEKFGEFLPGLKWVNLGGGHHITRPDYDRELLCRLVRRLRDRYGVEVYLEPGEAVALNAGLLAASVLDVIPREMPIAVLDASASAHMPDVLEMPYRPHIIGSGRPGEKKHTFRLAGPTCLAGDVIGDYSFDQPLRTGDKLAFTDMAHYSMVKTTTFNGVRLPSIALYRPEDDEVVIIREFGYDDYKHRLS